MCSGVRVLFTLFYKGKIEGGTVIYFLPFIGCFFYPNNPNTRTDFIDKIFRDY